MPRTSTEAFPHSCDYACAVQRFDRPAWRRLNRDDWVAIGSLVALALAIPFIWSTL